MGWGNIMLWFENLALVLQLNFILCSLILYYIASLIFFFIFVLQFIAHERHCVPCLLCEPQGQADITCRAGWYKLPCQASLGLNPDSTTRYLSDLDLSLLSCKWEWQYYAFTELGGLSGRMSIKVSAQGWAQRGVLQQMLLLPFPPLKATSLHLLFCSHTPLQAAFLLWAS